MAPTSRPLKILIVTTGKLLQPTSGGELRTLNLARSLARLGHAVDVVSFVVRNHPVGCARPAARLSVCQRHSLWLDLAALADRARLIPITELPLWLAPLRPWLRATVRRGRYDIVQFDFPWFLSLYAAAGPAPVIYSAHNVESAWWAPRLARYPAGEFFRRRLLLSEVQAASRATGVAACSPQDLAWLQQQLSAANAPPSRPAPRLSLVPNGFDAERFRPPAPDLRERLRRELGFTAAEKVVVFCGSHTHPNQQAVAAILQRIAPACPGSATHFLIVGRVGEAAAMGQPAPPGQSPPPRVTVTGPVADVLPFLQAADLALNPMLEGSGSNLKVVEACAAGLPLVTTPFGLRGFEPLAPWVAVCEIDGFAGAIAQSAWPNAIPPAVLGLYSWDAAAARLAELYAMNA